MPYTLGLVCFGQHEAAAVLTQDGKVVAAAEEERFTRKKFDNSFPINAISFCLQQGDIEVTDLAAVGFAFDPRRRPLAKALYSLRHLPGSIHLLTSRSRMLGQMRSIRELVRDHLGYAGPVYRLNHHLCHASSAFHPSPFREATVLALDGAGDWEACWIGTGRGRRLKTSMTVDWPLSLGHIYSAFTEYLGFQSFSDEYRVMGLAPYGDPSALGQEMAKIFWPTHNSYGVDLSYFDFPKGRIPRFGQKLVRAFGPPLASPDNNIPIHYRNVAAALQARLEEIVCHLVGRAVKRTNLKQVCLAGGVALNCAANGRLTAEGIASELYVPPCPSDSGTALGAAFLAHISVAGELQRQPLWTSRLGPEYTTAEIQAAISHNGLPAERVGDPAMRAAELLQAGKVVAWFQGRLEFSPRALGGRSILADPRRAEMKDIINSKVKFRESFRPFAPSVLEERASEFFHCAAPSPFMSRTVKVREERRGSIPAVIHADGSARIQTVSREHEPEFWTLIKRFEELTGVPLLLNTSFNIKGQPVVNTPDQAIETFLRTDIDALICGNFIVLKPGSNIAINGRGECLPDEIRC